MDIDITSLRIPHIANCAAQRRIFDNRALAHKEIDRLFSRVPQQVFGIKALEKDETMSLSSRSDDILSEMYLTLCLLNTTNMRNACLPDLFNFCKYIKQSFTFNSLRSNVEAREEFTALFNSQFPLIEPWKLSLDAIGSFGSLNKTTHERPIFFSDLAKNPSYILVEDRSHSIDKKTHYVCYVFTFGSRLGIPWTDYDRWFRNPDDYSIFSAGIKGDLVLYFSGSQIKHAGICVDSERTISKFCTGGIYLHGTWDTPKEYGNPMFYRPVYS